MNRRPRIAEVQCSRLKFQPGDRVLVRSIHRLELEEVKKLTRSIKRWAGVDVEVLIYCTQDLDIEIEKTAERLKLVGGS